VAISVHEFFHAFTAWRLGDPTAKNAGRLTLNPLRHLDPFGSLLLLVAGFGWGRPVPVNPRALRYGRFGMAMVSAAGPLSNLGVAFLTALTIRGIDASAADVPATLGRFLVLLLLLNVALCAFNLLPIAPLDGFGVAVGVLPWSIAGPIARLARYGPAILMLLVFSGYIIRIDLLHIVLDPLTRLLLAPLLSIARGA
jgi:Zn-dependent protease